MAAHNQGLTSRKQPPKVLRRSLEIVICFLLTAGLRGTAFTGRFESAPIRVKGSFVIAAICRDGIIVASDSRGTLKDRDGRRIAYYDVNQKIFPIGNNVVADTGYASLNDPKVSFLAALMSHFASSSLSHVQIDQMPESYFKYASLILPAAGADSAKLQTLIFAGYENGRPLLCIYLGEAGRARSCTSTGYLSSPRQEILGLAKVSGLSFAAAARVMQDAIDEYAAAVQPGSVGGPVVIRTITLVKSDWFKTPPNWPHWETFTDLAIDYENERVHFQLLPGIPKDQLDALVNAGAEWARAAGMREPVKSTEDAPVIGSYPADH